MSVARLNRIHRFSLSAMVVWRNRPVRYLVLCGALIVVAIAAGTATMVNDFRTRALADSERELKNTALILAEQVDRSFQSLELVQSSVVEKLQSLGIVSGGDYARYNPGQDLHFLLKSSISGLAQVNAISLIDADGNLVNSSRDGPLPAINVADRDYFKALKSNAQLKTFVSLPAHNRINGAWTLFLARKFTAPSGDFLGVVLGGVELSYFENLFSSLVLSKSSTIALFRNDGTLLAIYPSKGAVVGKSFRFPLIALGDKNSGTIRFMGEMEGKDRLMAAHRVAQYPLIITAVVDTDTALATWRQQTNMFLGAGGLAALTVIVMILLIVRQLTQGRNFANQRLRLERARLDTAVNNISQGLLLFDSSERIVVCNQRYIEMYGLSPDVAKPGCTFRELIAHRKATGSFAGDVDAYCSGILNSLSHDRASDRVITTADGRSIRLLNQPVAGGGWVAMHEDVTERRRLMQVHKDAENLAREQKLQLDSALNNMMQGLCMFGADGRIVLFNQRYLEMMDLPGEDPTGTSLRELLDRRKTAGLFTGDPEELTARVMESVRAGKPTTNITTALDGRALRIVAQPMVNGGWVATIEDITEQHKVAQQRDRDREFLNQIINSVPASITVKDAHTLQYVLVNKTAMGYFGRAREFIIGKTAAELWPQATADLIADHDEKLLRSDGSLSFEEHSFEAPGKGFRFITTEGLVIRDGKGAAKYLLGVTEDVTERKIANERIAHLAHYNSLTDLPNRALFREQLERALKWVHRGDRLAMLYLDLDQFKTVNDTLGHPVGDEFLKIVAARLRSCLRETDVVARLGGDEFAIIQTAITGPDDVIDLVARIHNAIREPCEAGGHQLLADASIGIALAPEDGTDPDQLLKNADLAMYGAKADGRSTYRFFEPAMDARVKTRRALELDLREAIASGGLELFYQPFVRLGDQKIAGFEALLRWRHPERGMISPAQFIPIAEETGLITALGAWVLRTACAEAATWPDGIKVAINVSPLQFKSGNLVQTVTDALAASRLPARRLELEITEAVQIDNDEVALAILHRLRELGVQIALDDFGTGYSSLSYLQRFPFDKIKIDRSFVKNVAGTDGSRSIVQAVVNIATARNITTTAEGVETTQQMEWLQALGCTEMQGYLFSPAIPRAKIAGLLVSNHQDPILAA